MKRLILLLICSPLILYSQHIPTLYTASYLEEKFLDWDTLEMGHYGCEDFLEIKCFNPSSTLRSQGSNNYSIKNMSDLDPKTAWVEGSFGYGIGESFMIRLDSSHSEIAILNGFQHSSKIWKQNSRVKKFKVSFQGSVEGIPTIFDIPICFLILEDKMGYQGISFHNAVRQWIQKIDLDKIDLSTVGNTYSISYDEWHNFLNCVLVFEILEVYKGDKWSDVAISGIDLVDASGCAVAR